MPATFPPSFDARYQLANDIPGGASRSTFQGPYLVKKCNHPHICGVTPDATRGPNEFQKMQASWRWYILVRASGFSHGNVQY